MLFTAYIRSWTSLAQQCAAVILFVIAIAVLGFVGKVLMPKIIYGQAQWRAAARQELGQLRGWAETADEAKLFQSQLTASGIWKDFYSERGNGDIAVAMQREIESMMTAVGAENTLSQPMEGAALKSINENGVRMTASMDIEQLRATVATVRAHVPYWRIQGLQVTAPQVDARSENPKFLVVADIIGYSLDAESVTQDAGQ